MMRADWIFSKLSGCDSLSCNSILKFFSCSSGKGFADPQRPECLGTNLPHFGQIFVVRRGSRSAKEAFGDGNFLENEIASATCPPDQDVKPKKLEHRV